MNIVFVSNYVPHYRVGLYEYLDQQLNLTFLFYSKGEEWYWQKEHGLYSGKFNHKYLDGFQVGNTAINFSLVYELIKTPYDVYIKCINGRFALPLTYLMARLHRKPFILWTGIWTQLQTPFHRLFFPITRYLYTHADAVVVYGNHVKKFLLDQGVKEEKIFIASQAVDNSFYSKEISIDEKQKLLDQFSIPKSKKVILYLGRLVKSKGPSLLLEAFANMRDNKDSIIVFAGKGPEEEHLRKLATDLNVMDNVRFTGHIKTHETVPYYSIAWVFVLNSITLQKEKEPWGNTINEAFCQGVPVITSDIVGAAADGFVKDGINGFIVPEGDINSLTSALERIIEDDDLRQRMSKNAKETVIDQNYERMGKGFLEAIRYTQFKQQN